MANARSLQTNMPQSDGVKWTGNEAKSFKAIQKHPYFFFQAPKKKLHVIFNWVIVTWGPFY